jgi:hypothetical protein
MVCVRNAKGGDTRFTEDAEAAFKNFVDVVCEMFQRYDADQVMGRGVKRQHDEDD